MKRVVIGAGASGGHIFPAIAVAEEIKSLDSEADICFIGVGRELEKKLIEGAGFKLKQISFVPLTGKGLRGIIRFLFALPIGVFKGVLFLRSFKADVLIAFGGYPSFVPIISAWILRIPRFLQEQNASVGLANRVLSRFVNKVFSVPHAKGFPEGVEIEKVSNPVRKEFTSITKWQMPEAGKGFRVLVLGGSQGAVSLNTEITKLVDLFKDLNVSLVHQTGMNDRARVEELYQKSEFTDVEVKDFISDMPSELERAHLVISRAGAMTIAEISAAGRPAIFVPLSIAEGHQKDNVRHLVEVGAARMVLQNDKFAELIREEILGLLEDSSRLQNMAEAVRGFSSVDGVRSAEFIAGELISES